jgi:hypothetical protein
MLGDMDKWFPWERLPNETGPSWAAFVIYRDQGPTRTLEATAKAVGKHSSTLGDFARRWDWQPRVLAWDAEVDRQRRAAFLKLQNQTIKKHVEVATKLRELATDAIGRIHASMLADEPRDALAFLQAAIKIEKTALGLPAETINHTANRDPMQIYFDNLDEGKLLEMTEQAVRVLKNKSQQHDEVPDGRVADAADGVADAADE